MGRGASEPVNGRECPQVDFCSPTGRAPPRAECTSETRLRWVREWGEREAGMGVGSKSGRVGDGLGLGREWLGVDASG